MRFRRRVCTALSLSFAILTALSLTGVAQAAPAKTKHDRSVGILREFPDGLNIPLDQDLRKLPAALAIQPDAPALPEDEITTKSWQSNKPEPVTFDECHPDPRAGSGYVVKNRLAACKMTNLRYQRYACPEANCPVVGSASVRVTVIFNLQPEQRRAVVMHKLYDWSIRDIPASTQIGIGISCGKVNKGTAYCDESNSEMDKSIAEWKDEPVDFQVLTMHGEDAPNPADAPRTKAEKRTSYLHARHFFVVDPDDTERVEDTPLKVTLRCDVARKLSSSYVLGSDCVFPVIAKFLLDTKEPSFKDAASFIAQAMHNYRSTYPGLAQGDFVPGRYHWNSADRKPPLTRLYYDTAAQNANRTRAENSCVEHWGPGYRDRPDGRTNDCFVYPFNSTTQGANAKPPNTPHGQGYAVQPTLSDASRILNAVVDRFTFDNHVLDGDQYWILLVE
ncbi:transporter [Amycolatopsis sp. NPDC059021]|uniref:transporter n=1 Tax=Amycolatopsis sp. NPDC059021 TaxID=3346704 RepID=UPI003671F4D1